jgi:hypothetical protein
MLMALQIPATAAMHNLLHCNFTSELALVLVGASQHWALLVL